MLQYDCVHRDAWQSQYGRASAKHPIMMGSTFTYPAVPLCRVMEESSIPAASHDMFRPKIPQIVNSIRSISTVRNLCGISPAFTSAGTPVR